MTDAWRAFELEEEITKQPTSGRPYREFRRGGGCIVVLATGFMNRPG